MSDNDAQGLYQRLKKEAEAAGYLLNPDVDFVMDLMAGLLTNKDRYGYLACPCRLAEGQRSEDLDIICPCNYRDPDLAEFGACYCALYVSDAMARGEQKLTPVPERRNEQSADTAPAAKKQLFAESSTPVHRCQVCGYLCARDKPPLKCPICKADQDRFERFA